MITLTVKKCSKYKYYILLAALGIFHNSHLVSANSDVEHYSWVFPQSYPHNVYWGDAHVHTNLSMFAFVFSNRTLGPDAAYRFAKGEAVTATNGMKAKLARPLDFIVVADHASNLGVMAGVETADENILQSPLVNKFKNTLKQADLVAASSPEGSRELYIKLRSDAVFAGEALTKKQRHETWQSVTTMADHYNQPRVFTAFIGYEWTGVPQIHDIHRIVVFKDGADKANKVLPFSQYDGKDPEDLWAYFTDYEHQVGGEILAIPHSGNTSLGVMFALENASGSALTAEYAAVRSRWEPLYEVTQIKGDSETHPLLSPEDSFADYATVSIGLDDLEYSKALKSQKSISLYSSWVKKNSIDNDPSWVNRYSFARSGLKLGLQKKARLGVNPFKFGLIGGTNSHTGLASADENNFWGFSSWVEPYPNRVKGSWLGKGVVPTGDSTGYFSRAWNMNAAGYTAIWAEENTRESLFDAMKRKEVYASTGPRIMVRFFGGWEYSAEDAFAPDLAPIGYGKGVPMGGDLTSAPSNSSPKFLIQAVRDPDGANLDRIQVIKGWLDDRGELQEKVYDVALSDQRKPNGRGQIKPVGSTVNIPNASYTNSIGDPELTVVWQDPDFDRNELAFYYARVLEIPTPRWTAYDAKYFGLIDVPDEIPMVTQERAYTSPIWYTPSEAVGHLE